MNKFEILGRHYFDEVQRPSRDSNLWLSYLVLREIYPDLTYWSYDGYHVDALVDYSRNILWDCSKITSVDRCIVNKEVINLYYASTEYIVKEMKGMNNV